MFNYTAELNRVRTELRRKIAEYVFANPHQTMDEIAQMFHTDRKTARAAAAEHGVRRGQKSRGKWPAANQHTKKSTL